MSQFECIISSQYILARTPITGAIKLNTLEQAIKVTKYLLHNMIAIVGHNFKHFLGHFKTI